MTKNLFQILALNTLLLFGVNGCAPQETNSNSQHEYNVQIFDYSPATKKGQEQRPTITIPNAKPNVIKKKTIPNSKNRIEDSAYCLPSVEEKIMTNEVLNQQKETSFDAVGYAGVGISINQMIKSFLPNLNEPLYNFETRAKLPININFEKKVEQPLPLYIERSSNRFEVYLKFKL